jgi:hypothetical protein
MNLRDPRSIVPFGLRKMRKNRNGMELGFFPSFQTRYSRT